MTNTLQNRTANTLTKAQKTRYILGLDPGLASTGFAVLQLSGKTEQVLDFGTITTPANTPIEDRLHTIHIDLKGLFETYHFDACAIEHIFFAKNSSSAILVAHAIGVMLCLARAFHIPCFRYSPTEVKSNLCGFGKADKLQLQQMLALLLKQGLPKSSNHATDAIAIAICHAQLSSINMKT